MSWLRHRFDDLKPAAMLKGGDFRARSRDFGGIDRRQKDARLGAGLGQNAAPRICDEGMSECFPAVLVLAALCRREHEGAVLDRTRAHEHMPMRLASLLGEG